MTLLQKNYHTDLTLGGSIINQLKIEKMATDLTTYLHRFYYFHIYKMSKIFTNWRAMDHPSDHAPVRIAITHPF
jgi:hypothetical protein